MTITPEGFYMTVTTIDTVLYTLSQALAFFGKPKIARKVERVSKMLDGLGGNHSHAANLVE